MSSHSITLESFKGNKTRHTCPSCGNRNEFTRYIIQETGEYIADHVGRCNREQNCGYHYKPKQYYEVNKYSIDFQNKPRFFHSMPKQAEIIKPIDYLPFMLLEMSSINYENNNYYLFLKSLFSDKVAEDLMSTYYVGSSHHWYGATCFWQIDIHGNLRQAKLMLYNSSTGKRLRKGAQVEKWNDKTRKFDIIITDGSCSKINGQYLIKSIRGLNLKQCFFGEVLLTMRPKDKVGIVESEKSAMVASIYFPDIIWLATGGSNGCMWTQKEVCKVLEGRQIILFPDLGYYDKWCAKADIVNKLVNCNITVSEFLEINATENQKTAGLDIADFLLMNRDTTNWALTPDSYPIFWDIKIPA